MGLRIIPHEQKLFYSVPTPHTYSDVSTTRLHGEAEKCVEARKLLSWWPSKHFGVARDPRRILRRRKADMDEKFCLVSCLCGLDKVLSSSMHAPVVIASFLRHHCVFVLACGVCVT
jgi:hypothetical protein